MSIFVLIDAQKWRTHTLNEYGQSKDVIEPFSDAFFCCCCCSFLFIQLSCIIIIYYALYELSTFCLHDARCLFPFAVHCLNCRTKMMLAHNKKRILTFYFYFDMFVSTTILIEFMIFDALVNIFFFRSRTPHHKYSPMNQLVSLNVKTIIYEENKLYSDTWCVVKRRRKKIKRVNLNQNVAE